MMDRAASGSAGRSGNGDAITASERESEISSGGRDPREREREDEDEEGRDGCGTLMLVVVWSVYVRFVLLRCEWRWRIKGFGV